MIFNIYDKVRLVQIYVTKMWTFKKLEKGIGEEDWHSYMLAFMFHSLYM